MEIITAIGYWGLVLGLLFLLAFFVLFLLASLISAVSGIPFVGSQQRKLAQILAEIQPQEGAIFYDLGSGDGRAVFIAADKFKLKATGIETNPILIVFSNLYKRIFRLDLAHFKQESILKTDFSDADIIYLFLFPQMLEKLAPRIQELCKPGTRIISHGFQIKPFNSLLTHTRAEKPFSTYYYTI